MSSTDGERMRRWRLVLGGEAEDEIGTTLSAEDRSVDAAMAALYDATPGEPGSQRASGLGSSAPRVARWLGDIRKYFPSTVVQVMQRDAVERLGITRMLMEPELLGAVEPDVHLVSTLLALNEVMPEETKQTARDVVGRVVALLEARLAERTRAAVTGALDRAGRTGRPRHSDIDWDRTIRANLKHYSPALGTIVPDRLVGYARRNHSVQRDIVLAIDQSGSMAESVVYASLFGAVLGSIRTLRTSLVVFDTAVVDLTDQLEDPVDVLFGTQLGGGTDINRALAYCEELVTKPAETVMVLISDLYEGGVREEMLRRARTLVESGVQLIALLALSDSGTPSYDAENAAALADLGVPTFACTPDLFPDLMAAAIRHEDITGWAATNLSGSN
ncbi:VWA domain-containing protein [Kribbella sp. NPDC023972]|uniref:VWA domain-containing protein n=1 Tax=Kribbella sp. NPDC023972 TaxID=3154795 RepID=UPI0033D5801F